MLVCQHCGWRKAGKPKGLCYKCYYTVGVRDLYPARKSNRRGVEDFCGSEPLPLVSTPARPGTDGKIAVMEERAARGQSLWHPADAGVNLS